MTCMADIVNILHKYGVEPHSHDLKITFDYEEWEDDMITVYGNHHRGLGQILMGTITRKGETLGKDLTFTIRTEHENIEQSYKSQVAALAALFVFWAEWDLRSNS